MVGVVLFVFLLDERMTMTINAFMTLVCPAIL